MYAYRLTPITAKREALVANKHTERTEFEMEVTSFAAVSAWLRCERKLADQWVTVGYRLTEAGAKIVRPRYWVIERDGTTDYDVYDIRAQRFLRRHELAAFKSAH